MNAERAATGSIGREEQRRRLDAAVATALDGDAIGVVIEGAAGLGKTLLWQEALDDASSAGLTVLSCRAVQSELGLAFTALTDLFGDVDDDVFEPLPAPQRSAIDLALLRGDATPTARPPDQRSLGMAIVRVISTLALSAPVLIAVDDASWVDPSSARALGFALRRLRRARVAAIMTHRTRPEPWDVFGLEPDRTSEAGPFSDSRSEVMRIELGPLPQAAMRDIVLRSKGTRTPLRRVRQIATMAKGNPLHAVELVRALEAAEDGADGSVSQAMGDLIAERYLRLPATARRAALFLAASADALDLRARNIEALGPAIDAGLVRVRQRRAELAHPLYQTAILELADPSEVVSVHAQLANDADSIVDRARHLALSTREPDAAVAVLLDQGVAAATARGAIDLAAELAEHSLRVTPPRDCDGIERRMLAAAEAQLAIGAHAAVRSKAHTVLASSADHERRAAACQLLVRSWAFEDPAVATTWAEEGLRWSNDPIRRGHLHLDRSMGLLARYDLVAAHEDLEAAVRTLEGTTAPESLARALSSREQLRHLLGMPSDRAALERATELAGDDDTGDVFHNTTVQVSVMLTFLGECERARSMLQALLRRLEDRGHDSDAPWVLANLSSATGSLGDFTQALAEAQETVDRSIEMNQMLPYVVGLVVRGAARGVRGDADAARADIHAGMEHSMALNWPVGAIIAGWAIGHIPADLGDDGDAKVLAAIEPLVAQARDRNALRWPSAMAARSLIESAIRKREWSTAERLVTAIERPDHGSPPAWAQLVAARARAARHVHGSRFARAEATLASALTPGVEELFPFEAACALKALADVQTLRGSPSAASTRQRAAALFERCGATYWSEALDDGAVARTRQLPATVRPIDALTPQERRVAEKAMLGRTNREIADELHLSPKTVDHYLQRAYRRLGVKNRTTLAALIGSPSERSETPPEGPLGPSTPPQPLR